MKKWSYPKWHLMGIWIAIGIPIGLPIWLALWNIGFWPAIGLAIWVPIWILMEKKYNIKPIEPTEKEKKTRRRNLWIVLVLWVILVLAVLAQYLVVK